MSPRPRNDRMQGKAVQAKASPEHWEAVWRREAPEPVNLNDRSLRNHMNLLLGAFFARHLPPAPDPGQGEPPLLIEAGCGASAWLPVFATRHGYRVRGLDYSAQGCGLARAVLRKAGVVGEVFQADLFNPPPELTPVLAGRADVVFSQGLAEHFLPTRGVVQRLAWLARPGGLVLTLVPNMRGLTGLAQRLLDARVYALHTPLSPAALARAHHEAGLAPLAWGHLGLLNLGVVNPARFAARPLVRRFLGAALAAPSLAAWALERVLAALCTRPGPRLANGISSPLVYCVARKPAGVDSNHGPDHGPETQDGAR